MAKTKLNNSKRFKIKKIINQYIQNEFNKDERFTKFKEKIDYFTELVQKEYETAVNITQEVKDFLELANMWGSVEVVNRYFPYYQVCITIQGCYGYNCQFSIDKLCDKYPYLKDGYRSEISSNNLAYRYLDSLEEFQNWITDFDNLNEEYSKLCNKMYLIVDNCKYVEDIKEYLPIDEVIKYVNETLYNCSTFISVVTSEDVNLVKEFINKNKNNS